MDINKININILKKTITVYKNHKGKLLCSGGGFPLGGGCFNCKYSGFCTSIEHFRKGLKW